MSDEAMAQQIEQLQVDLADEKEVSRNWSRSMVMLFRKYCQNERRLEDCRREISALQNELGRLRQQLAAVGALNADAAAAGHQFPGLHYSMTMLRDWLTRRLEDWPREHQDDMDADLLRRLFALDSAWAADRVSQAQIIALIETQRKAGTS